ncbi:hypothetical protein DICVIV_08297 [Dictyocaulus viviparus]|uniref:Transforming acidic coiled-coil-containing protein C-terminal domain-containing protein n=1 Tax=Dictyocaulus viviparus TaxID=29172 RepID=A0A0D8XPG1_DICVI|nr:hypothetical protein DICVIV_08297 [Dictyocaulus viviparus]
MEHQNEEMVENGSHSAAMDTATTENSINAATVFASDHRSSTPISKPNPNVTIDPSRTFTRRPTIQKDISPIPDNVTNIESGTPRANVRASRQKTMTMVDSSGVHELKRLFADARASFCSKDLEKKIVELLRSKDVEYNTRLNKALEQIEQLEKHECTNNEANLMVYRALVSEYQMMLEELTSGAYIHVGRLEDHGYRKSGSCGGACKAASERDTVKAELDSMHEDYGKLFESYKKIRKLAEEQKMEYSALHDKFIEKIEDNKRIQGKMSRLREDARNKLEQASKDMADCLRERDESLVGLRLKVRQLEMDLKSSQRELEIKKNEATELRDICNQLMSQVEPGSDIEQ